MRTLIHCCVANVTTNDSANQNEQMEISVIQAPNGCIHKV